MRLKLPKVELPENLIISQKLVQYVEELYFFCRLHGVEVNGTCFKYERTVRENEPGICFCVNFDISGTDDCGLFFHFKDGKEHVRTLTLFHNDKHRTKENSDDMTLKEVLSNFRERVLEAIE